MVSKRYNYNYFSNNILLVFLILEINYLFANHGAKADNLPRFEHPVKSDGSLSIMVVGDWGRKGLYNQSEVAYQMGIIGEKMDLDFVISTGDNFYPDGLTDVNDPAFDQSFTNVYTAPSLQKQWYTVLGNHDYRGDALAQLSPLLNQKDSKWFCLKSYILNAGPLKMPPQRSGKEEPRSWAPGLGSSDPQDTPVGAFLPSSHHGPQTSSTPTPPDLAASKRKRKSRVPASILDLSSGDSGEPSRTSNRQPTPPLPYTPRLPYEYTAQASLFKAPYSDLGAHIIGSLGSEAERAVFASKELTSSVNGGFSMALLGLMQLHHGMTRMTERCQRAERDLGQTQGGLLSDMDAAMKNAKMLYDNMERSLRQRLQATEADLGQARLQAQISMDEIRSSEAKAEAQRSEADLAKETTHKARAEVAALKAEVEATKAEAAKARADAETSRAEATRARADLDSYIAGEGDRKAALLSSPEFVDMVGPRAFKYLKVGFDGCRGILQEQGLIPEDRGPNFPDFGKFIESLPEDI